MSLDCLGFFTIDTAVSEIYTLSLRDALPIWLVPVLTDWRPVGLFGDCLCAIRPYSPTVPKAVQVFVAWLREALKDGFPLAR